MRISSLIPLFGYITLATLANLGILPNWISQIYDYPGGDKLGHLIIAALLALSLNLGLACRRWSIYNISFFAGSVVILIIMTLEETSQLWFSNRTFSLYDLGSNYFGILLSSLILRWLILKTGQHSQT